MNKPRCSACPLRFVSQSYTASAWVRHYQDNRLGRTEPEWGVPCLLDPEVRGKLAVSLSHFQLGETGGGTFLLGQASKNSCSDDLAALTLFVREENEHARLLEHMVHRLGGALVKRHWTQALFKLVRRAGDFHFEIQMLLTAEIVGTAYYELLHEGVQDGPITYAIGLMLRDEAGHVAFHTDRMRTCWHGWLPFERTLWQAQFQALILVAARAAWLDHAPCLRALGFTWDDFDQRIRRTAIAFLDNLHREVAEPAHPLAPVASGA